MVHFPEADPDSVDIMVRHLYRESTVAITIPYSSNQLTKVQELNVEALKTPLLCVRCWKLADYVQSDSLKSLATSKLSDHLDAMVLLASNDLDLASINPTPKWVRHFFDAFQEACTDEVTKPLQHSFVAFLWVTRFHTLELPQTLDILNGSPGVTKELLRLLVRNRLDTKPDWIPVTEEIERDIRNKKETPFISTITCSGCRKSFTAGVEPRFYNPFPTPFPSIFHGKKEDSMWCKGCVVELNGNCKWPWRTPLSLGPYGRQVKVEAWSWSDGE